jgi:hypothetical protein
MVLRLLFGLTTSLLSGLAVAILLSAVVGQFFSDPADSHPQLSILEARQDVRSAGRPSITGPTSPEIKSVALAVDVPETGQKPTPHPATQQGSEAGAPSDPRPTGQQRQSQRTALAPGPSPNVEPVLSHSQTADFPAESAAALPKTTPDLATSSQVSVQEQTTPPAPNSEQNSPAVHPHLARLAEAKDAHARVAAASRPTRARPLGHAARAEHVHRGHSTARGITAIAQHQAPM